MKFTKQIYSLIFFSLSMMIFSQNAASFQIPKSSVFSNLKTKDSVVFYQCHVETAKQELTTSSGQHIQGEEQPYSITEKYVIKKQNQGYTLNYSQASLTVFPNKKFTGLKFKEKSYWKFNQTKKSELSEADLRVFVALEQKGRDAIVYDYAITKYSKNQIIIRYTDDYKQLLIDGEYVISKLIKLPQD